MAHSNSHTRDGLSKAGIITRLVNLTANGIATLKQRYNDARTRRALAGLTHNERLDIACVESTPKPVIEIEAGVMTKLMSMR